MGQIQRLALQDQMDVYHAEHKKHDMHKIGLGRY